MLARAARILESRAEPVQLPVGDAPAVNQPLVHEGAHEVHDALDRLHRVVAVQQVHVEVRDAKPAQRALELGAHARLITDRACPQLLLSLAAALCDEHQVLARPAYAELPCHQPAAHALLAQAAAIDGGAVEGIATRRPHAVQQLVYFLLGRKQVQE